MLQEGACLQTVAAVPILSANNQHPACRCALLSAPTFPVQGCKISTAARATVAAQPASARMLAAVTNDIFAAACSHTTTAAPGDDTHLAYQGPTTQSLQPWGCPYCTIQSLPRGQGNCNATTPTATSSHPTGHRTQIDCSNTPGTHRESPLTATIQLLFCLAHNAPPLLQPT